MFADLHWQRWESQMRLSMRLSHHDCAAFECVFRTATTTTYTTCAFIVTVRHDSSGNPPRMRSPTIAHHAFVQNWLFIGRLVLAKCLASRRQRQESLRSSAFRPLPLDSPAFPWSPPIIAICYFSKMTLITFFQQITYKILLLVLFSKEVALNR